MDALLTDSNVQKKFKAAGKSLVWWLAFYYIFVAHCFVLWKWQTPNLNTNSSDVNAAIQRLRTALTTTRTSRDNLEGNLSELGRLLRRLESQQGEIVSEEETDATVAVGDDNDNNPLPVIRTKQLLNVPDLSALRSSTAVSKMFDGAISELEQYMELPTSTTTTMMENLIQTILLFSSSSDENDIVPKRETIQMCPQTLDLQMSSQSGGLPGMNDEHILKLETIIRAGVLEVYRNKEQQKHKQQNQNNDNNNINQECLPPSAWRDVDKWIYAGLDAMERKQDVRQALLEVTQWPVILDDMNLATTTNSVYKSNSNITLRDLIDGPHLYDYVRYIDVILHRITGHSEAMDGIVDEYIYKHIPEDAEVGQTIAFKLLELAEYVGPLPQAARVWR